jgi:hypothetical protein
MNAALDIELLKDGLELTGLAPVSGTPQVQSDS